MAEYSFQASATSEISKVTMNGIQVALFVVFAAAAVQALNLTAEQKEKVRAYHKECSASSGVDQELITKGRKGEFVDDPKLKEFVFCFFKKAGFQNEAGEIQPAVIKAKNPADNSTPEIINAIDKCGAIKSDTPQQTAYDAIKCYWDSTRLSLY